MKENMANATQYIKENIGTIGAGVGGIALGGVVGYIAGRSSRSKKKSKSKSRYSSARKRNRVFKKKKGQRYTPHTAGKRKDTSHRRIRYTTKGQPYVITSKGRAKFISKKSAKTSRKRSGGRY